MDKKEKEARYVFYPTGRDMLADKDLQEWVGKIKSLYKVHPLAIIIKTKKI